MTDIGQILGLGSVTSVELFHSASGRISSSSFKRIDCMIRNIFIERKYLNDLASVHLNIGDHEIDSVLPPWTYDDTIFALWTCSQLSLPLEIGNYIASFLLPTGIQVPFYLNTSGPGIPIAKYHPVVIHTVSHPGCRTVPLSCELVTHEGWRGIRFEDSSPLYLPMKHRYIVEQDCRANDNEFVYMEGKCGWRIAY